MVIKKTYLLAFLAILVVFSIILVVVLYQEDEDKYLSNLNYKNGSIFTGTSNFLLERVELEVGDTVILNSPTGYKLDLSQALPTFITTIDNRLELTPKKSDVGINKIYFKDSLSDLYNINSFIEVNIVPNKWDNQLLSSKIEEYLGERSQSYGVFVYDLINNNSFSLNGDSQFRTASIVKVPIAVMLMNAIENNLLQLDSVLPLKEELIFNYQVGAGIYPVGTELTMNDYLSLMLQESDNTSLNHIDYKLSEIYNKNLNSKINEVLNVNFFVNPPETTPKQVGEIFKGLYMNSFLTKVNSAYLLNLLKGAVPDLKNGIANGLPSGVDFANKIGFLDTFEDLSYMDAAIVYGLKTDYVVVVLNKNTDWSTAIEDLKSISNIIYTTLN